jgi:biopolymer transport protein ExbD
VRERLNLARGGDYRIKHVMQPLAPGEASESRPQPTEPVPATLPPTGTIRYEPPPASATGASAATGFGAVSIRVQPADAVVLIDGERWDTPPASDRLVVQLSPGPHQVEIRRDGHVPYSTVVEIRAREATVLNVSLPRN